MASERWWQGVQRYQWTVLIVAWLGWTFDVMDAAFFNLAKQPMLTELMGAGVYKEVGQRVEGNIQMLFFLGWAIGGLLFGALADRIGRTRTMVITILIYCVFTGATALCATWQQVAI
ncbi:MAG TPA: MFS transporter, partial [Fimbriimonadaceae bacterium]|nr:MFS transporter [Fimbriimonadaceae bacterium]